MLNPVSTYRIQFHKDFRFQDFFNCLRYLKLLGIKTVYASPIFKAVPGSNHGYDALDPNSINPEIGSIEELREMGKQLKQEGMHWLQDIVPNHMAFDPRNPWLYDILEKGRKSAFAGYFDILWDLPGHEGKLMVPFLGSSMDEVLEKNELRLDWKEGKLLLCYYDSCYPCNAAAYKKLLQHAQELSVPMQDDEELISNSFNNLVQEEAVKLDALLDAVNSDPLLLKEMADLQYYRLCHWQETDSRINYRRFFTINGLICLNIQDEHLFDHFHQLTEQLLQEGVISGLRIDHIDGLFDPPAYLQKLHELAGDRTYVTIEKILQPGESIPAHWKTSGNTGYDFLAIVNNLFTSRVYEEPLRRFYHDISSVYTSFEEQLREKKRYILYHHMNGELDNLVHLFITSGLESGQVAHELLRKAIGEMLVYCPVYRFYGNRFPLDGTEARSLENIFQKIQQSQSELSPAIALLSNVLLHQPLQADAMFNNKALYFYQRCMQFSGPLMAKGFEDTLMYTYHLQIAHSEVGDSSDAFGYTVKEFHEHMENRQKHLPYSMNATATHDTKRGEDVRARLHVLSELAPEWLSMMEAFKVQHAGTPDLNDAYFICQTLMGHYPFPGMDMESFAHRLEAFIQKALREGKLHSSWSSPDPAYEAAAIDFAKRILQDPVSTLPGFHALLPKVMDHGVVNSLIQLVLKFMCPGIPDVYQGTELWDLSFVDPDNRRPVDYKQRLEWLEEFSQDTSFLELWEQRYDGRIKLWLTHQLLALRQRYPELLAEGEYIPLAVKGKYREHIVAFARKHRQQVLIITLPLFTATLCKNQDCSILEVQWEDTRVELPSFVLPGGEDLLAPKKCVLHGALQVQELFSSMPLSILHGEVVPNERNAGILLHLSSLPSAFGIGDMGPESRTFADFLFRSYQKYWQLLPLNPTEEGQGHSPYSATSSRAGNLLFISPELLVKDGLLAQEDLHEHLQPQLGKVDYKAAVAIKENLLHKAWLQYRQQPPVGWEDAFEIFIEKEKEWLHAFSAYMILKHLHRGRPWYEWPDAFKSGNEDAINTLILEHQEEYIKQQWLQFVFTRQWQELKHYCNSRGIQLIGDLPFYVSYDSADVWANPELFKLDSKGHRKGIAGVPPDAFSEDGQLWGMPVFRWKLMRQNGFAWWISRLRKNIEMFDLVRLDHFRAFAAYWEVPAGEETARNGRWIKGPGAAFFSAIKNALGALPFIAEDLGDIDAPVYELRDRFRLPGMKVLQFAFGDDVGTSPHAPHNYDRNFIVYTGTHDNNTTRGWWREEGAGSRPYMEAYMGRTVHEDEVPDLLCRLAYASVAGTVIIPYQDLLGLDAWGRMNMPSSVDGNWAWRLLPEQLHPTAEEKLKAWTGLYNRR